MKRYSILIFVCNFTINCFTNPIFEPLLFQTSKSNSAERNLLLWALLNEPKPSSSVCSVPVPSTTATKVYGQNGSFTSNSSGTTASTLSQPNGTAFDSSGNFYVADSFNHRILVFASGSTTAIKVYGQSGSFTTKYVNDNNSNPTSSSFRFPEGVALDPSGGLYVADTNNNRALYFPSGSTTATRVYGQSGDFTTAATNATTPTADTLYAPVALALDSADGLYIADAYNNRVLYYPSGSTTATRVYGQGGSFTTNSTGSVTEATLNRPNFVTLDSSDGLYISDSKNNRVLYYPSGSITPTRVYGQGGSFTSNTANLNGISADSLNSPMQSVIDSCNNLYLVDELNYRVLFFPSNSTTATKVYGQNDSFTSNTSGVSATQFGNPFEITIGPDGGFYITDTGNERILYFPTQ